MDTYKEINRSQEDIWLVHGGTATDGTIYGPPNKATPWGSAGCPLLPRSYRTMFGNQKVRVFSSLIKRTGASTVFIADLNVNFLCRFGLSKLSAGGAVAITNHIHRLPVPPGQIVIPSGVPMRWIMELPIRKRTRNVLGQIIEQKEKTVFSKNPSHLTSFYGYTP